MPQKARELPPAHVGPKPDLRGVDHLGFLWQRIFQPGGELERAFAERWAHHNKHYDLLQQLFCVGNGIYTQPHLEIGDRDRYVAATVIQWLGTNVGFSFLQEALMKRGYLIVGSEPRKPENRLVQEILVALAAAEIEQLSFDLSEPT